MKNILVPTDFSAISINALEYAAEIAIHMNAKITLFHAYHTPPVTVEFPVVEIPLKELERSAMKTLKRIGGELEKKYGGKLKIDYSCNCGFAVDQIKFYLEHHRADLIVMGMHGAGFLTRALIGSITTALIREASCPVLAIEQSVKFSSLKKIVLACDIDNIPSKKTLLPLKKLAAAFHSRIYFLNVLQKGEKMLHNKAILAAGLAGAFPDTEHQMCVVENGSVADGINGFAAENKVDMIVMVPSQHKGLSALFEIPNTRRVAFETKVPLMALPYKK